MFKSKKDDDPPEFLRRLGGVLPAPKIKRDHGRLARIGVDESLWPSYTQPGHAAACKYMATRVRCEPIDNQARCRSRRHVFIVFCSRSADRDPGCGLRMPGTGTGKGPQHRHRPG